MKKLMNIRHSIIIKISYIALTSYSLKLIKFDLDKITLSDQSVHTEQKYIKNNIQMASHHKKSL